MEDFRKLGEKKKRYIYIRRKEKVLYEILVVVNYFVIYV